jgi:hypothetical protein
MEGRHEAAATPKGKELPEHLDLTIGLAKAREQIVKNPRALEHASSHSVEADRAQPVAEEQMLAPAVSPHNRQARGDPPGIQSLAAVERGLGRDFQHEGERLAPPHRPCQRHCDFGRLEPMQPPPRSPSPRAGTISAEPPFSIVRATSGVSPKPLPGKGRSIGREQWLIGA